MIEVKLQRHSNGWLLDYDGQTYVFTDPNGVELVVDRDGKQWRVDVSLVPEEAK